MIWISGSVVLGIGILVNNITFARNVKEERRLFAKCPYGNLKIYKISGLDSPFLFWNGIYIPEELSEDSIEYSLAVCHEYCHYKFGDCIWNVIRCLMVVVLWFDPLVWVAYFLSQNDSELAVDEKVLELIGEDSKLKYGEMLLKHISIYSGYNRLMSITRDLRIKAMQAQTEADIKDYSEGLRIKREEGQYAMRKATQSSNFAAYQVESQTKVGTATADALGKMGSSGAGEVNLGSVSGFNPAAMMASVAVGGAMGQNLAGVVGGAMQPGAVPPPIKQSMYHVAINDEAVGPFDINSLKIMINAGQINKQTLVWKKGMTDWAYASSVVEINTLFDDDSIPPIPSKRYLKSSQYVFNFLSAKKVKLMLFLFNLIVSKDKIANLSYIITVSER